jgi:hypothetical protein
VKAIATVPKDTPRTKNIYLYWIFLIFDLPFTGETKSLHNFRFKIKKIRNESVIKSINTAFFPLNF